MSDRSQSQIPKNCASSEKEHGCSNVGEVVHAITATDILCGRGSGPNDHRGNIVFRQIVSTRRAEYLATSTRVEKVRIANEILSVVKNLQPPARFLEKVENSDKDKSGYQQWTVASEHKAIEKIKQALRQMRHRKSDSSALYFAQQTNITDFSTSKCMHRRVKSAPEAIFNSERCLPGGGDYPHYHHSPNYLNVSEGSYHSSPYYQYPAKHAEYKTSWAPSSCPTPYTYNNAPIVRSSFNPPPPIPPPPPPPILTSASMRTNSPSSSVQRTPSPTTRSANHAENIISQRRRQAERTALNSRGTPPDRYTILPDPPISAIDIESHPPVPSFDPAPARFVYKASSATIGNNDRIDKNEKINQKNPSDLRSDENCISTLTLNYVFNSSSSISMFESSSSSALLPLAMDAIEREEGNDSEDVDLTTVFDEEKQLPQESTKKSNSNRSRRYLSSSTHLEELSTRNLGGDDDFFGSDDCSEYMTGRNRRRRAVVKNVRNNNDNSNNNNNNNNNNKIVDINENSHQRHLEFPSFDDISIQLSVTSMIDTLKSDNSLMSDALLDSKSDLGHADKFDRMVMAVTEPLDRKSDSDSFIVKQM